MINVYYEQIYGYFSIRAVPLSLCIYIFFKLHTLAKSRNSLWTSCFFKTFLLILKRGLSSDVDIIYRHIYWQKWMFTPSLFPDEYFSCHCFLKATTSLWMSEQKFKILEVLNFPLGKPHSINNSTCRYSAWGSYNKTKPELNMQNLGCKWKGPTNDTAIKTWLQFGKWFIWHRAFVIIQIYDRWKQATILETKSKCSTIKTHNT